jgi:RHS repeat-associated protein
MRVTSRLLPTEQAVVVTIDVPMLGTSIALRTDWSSGRAAAATWVVPDAAGEEQLTFTVAGTSHEVPVAPDGTARFSWDGRGPDGKLVGPATATTTVGGEQRVMRLGRWDALLQGVGGLMVRGDDHLDTLYGRIHTASGRLRANVHVRGDQDGWVVSRSRGRTTAHFDAGGALTEVRDAATGEVVRRHTRDAGGLSAVEAGARALRVTRSEGGVQLARGVWTLRILLDEDGRATQLLDPSERGVQLRWDGSGLLTGVTDASGFVRTYEYDADGRLVARTLPGRGRAALARVAVEHGHRVTVLTAEGRESSSATERLPDGTRVRTRRCCGDEPEVTRTQDGTITVARPDGTRVVNDLRAGRRAETRPSGTTRTRTVRADAIVVNGRTHTVKRDASSSRVVSPGGREVGLARTDRGVRVTGPGGTTELVRDEHGRVVRVESPDGNADVTYDDRDLPETVRWDAGTATSFEHDASGWLVAQHLQLGREVRQERDGGGLVTAVTTPGGTTTSFRYAAPGRLAGVSFAAPAGVEDELSLTYDRDGLVVGRTVSGRPAVTYRRGAAGTVEQVVCGDEVTTLEHAHGRLVRAITADGQRTTIERDGRVVAGLVQDGPVPGRVAYEVDEHLATSAIASDGLRVEIVHDEDGLVSRVGEAAVTTDTAGNRTGVTIGVLRLRHEHDALGRLASTTLDAGDRRLWSLALERDALGRIATLRDSRLPGPVAYTYDAAGRLTGAHGGLDDVELVLDAAGNPTSITRHGETVATELAVGDRLVALGATRVVHGGGGMVDGVGPHAVGRRGDGRVVAVDGPGGRTTLRRDARGAIVAVALAGDDRGETRLVAGRHARPEVVVDEHGEAMLLLAGVTGSASPVLAVGADRSYLLVSDHVGSLRLVVDTATGEVVEARDYDAWGRRIRHEGHSHVPYGWAGGVDDPANDLVHFPARTYSPELMRWLGRDPLLFLGGSANLWSYADGDPVNRRDPSGAKVEICRAPSNMFGMDVEHWWIRTDSTEAGMWPDPTMRNTLDYYGNSTAVVDHGGEADNRPGAECDEVPDVDERCVDGQLEMNKAYPDTGTVYGRNLGDWTPITNTCQNFVDDVLSACSGGEYTVETDDPDSYDAWYQPDITTVPKPISTPVVDYTPDPGYSSEETGQLWE